MNNKNKFRAYDKKQKKWLESVPSLEYLLDDPDGDISHHDVDYESAIYSFPRNLFGDDFKGRIVWQQYTGLKDKLDQEIYEGDILQEVLTQEGAVNGDTCTIDFVVFRSGAFQLNDDGELLYDHVFSISPEVLEDFLKIGNIFDNPELLK